MPALLNAVNALLRLGLPAKAACCLVLAPQDSESPAGVQQASPCAARHNLVYRGSTSLRL